MMDGEHHERIQEATSGKLLCLGFEYWKQGYFRNFLSAHNNQIHFCKQLRASELTDNAKVVVWGTRISSTCRQLVRERGVPLYTVEDGFIRSLNLGKYGSEPLSLVIDTSGIYFDPESGSDLEQILEKADFREEELQEAVRIRDEMLANSISKYNLGTRSELQLHTQEDQRVILVPGQVGQDASIVLGCDQIDSNIKLLKAARLAQPDAFILFKPHPDVVSGNVQESDTYEGLADHIEADASIHSCLNFADEVHTMTSLVGFEGLLAGKDVHTYGRPFYAGWGLTIDHSRLSMPKRTRRLSLEQLIAGTLIHYPRYIDPVTKEITSVSRILDFLKAEIARKGAPRHRSSVLERWLLKTRYGGKSILYSFFR